MAVKYKFEVKPQSVVTPLGETFFMCLAEVNEVTGQFGGSLLFTEDQLDNEVTFKEWVTGTKVKKGFQQGIDDLIDEALEDYNSNNKKRKAKRADKIIVHLDKEGEETDLFEFKIKNKDQPKIVDKFKQRIKDFDELLGNGSTIKCQVNLVPYFMQGKVGVTAYVDYVLIKEVVEYGGGAENPFDDDDFDDDAHGFDEDEEEEDEPEEEEPVKKPVRKPRAKPATTTEGEKDDF